MYFNLRNKALGNGSEILWNKTANNIKRKLALMHQRRRLNLAMLSQGCSFCFWMIHFRQFWFKFSKNSLQTQGKYLLG
jgi:hypothetical protein